MLVDTNILQNTLPSDFQRFVNLRVTTAGLEANIKDFFMTPDDFRNAFPAAGIRDTGNLTYWTYWTSVEFSNKANLTYTVAYDYIKSIPLMSVTTDIPLIPESFEELLMVGAKMRIYEQKEDFDYSSQYSNRYADLLESFTTRYSTRQVDTQANVPGSRVRV